MHEKPQVSYSFRDDTLIMAFVKNGFGVTVSQDLVMRAFSDGVEVRPLEPEVTRTNRPVLRPNNQLRGIRSITGLPAEVPAEIRFEPIRLRRKDGKLLFYIYHASVFPGGQQFYGILTSIKW